MPTISWVHLSDWHQGDESFDRQVVLRKLLEDVERRDLISNDLKVIDFAIFSGDLSNSGKRAEFDIAWTEFLQPTLKTLSVPKERLFIVPGNHDIDEERFDLLPQVLTRPFKNREESLPWLTDPEKLAVLLKPFSAYESFLKTQLPHQAPFATSATFDLRGVEVGVAGLNSAVMCRRNRDSRQCVNDQNFLVIGEAQAQTALDAIKPSQIRIAVTHHPIDWLAQFDRDDLETFLGDSVHFVLTGHAHKSQFALKTTPGNSYVLIPVGASFDRRQGHGLYYNSYNFVQVDLEKASGTIYFRRWSEARRGWMRDDELVDGGYFRFELPESLKPHKSPPNVQGTPAPTTISIPAPSIPASSDRPQRITVIGPLTGELSAFGLSQARGIVAALLHGLEEGSGRELVELNPLGTDRLADFFRFEWIDSALYTPEGLREKLTGFYSLPPDSEKRPDVIFGPMQSGEAASVFWSPELPVSIRTILITAGTTEIDNHTDYGLNLLRPAPTVSNAAQHAAVFAYYYVGNAKSACDAVFVVYRQDQYGEDTFTNINRELIGRGLPVIPIPYVRSSDNGTAEMFNVLVRDKVQASVKSLKFKCPLAFLAETGENLKNLVQSFHRNLPSCVVATLSSINSELLLDDGLNGLFVFGTFCAGGFSLNEPTFGRYIRTAQQYLEKYHSFKAIKWMKPDSVDAEVHDGTIFWLDRISDAMPRFMPRVFRDLYITNLRMVKAGPQSRLRNATAIAVFRVIERQLQVVHVGRNNRDRIFDDANIAS